MNKQKSVVIVALSILLVGGIVWAYFHTNIFGNHVKNSEMLWKQNNTPILTEDNVTYFGDANGYFARPEAPGEYPGVVLIHENRGLRPEIRATANQLAKEGYYVLAVDLFGAVVETQDEARKLTAAYNQEMGIKNLRAAVSHLKKKGATKVASLGWCFGGGQSLQLALSGEKMDATILYYGKLVTDAKALAPIKWPVLGIFGGADQSISADSVKQFGESLDLLNIANEIYIYPGVGHAFANPSGMNYAPKETMAAWEKTTAFLKKHLK